LRLTVNGITPITDGSAKAIKRTVLGETAMIINPGNGKVPNISTINKLLTFYADTLLMWRDKNYVISSDTNIDLSTTTSSAKKLYFNTSTNAFQVFNYGETLNTVITENHLLVATIRLSGSIAIASLSCPYTVDGKYLSDSTDVSSKYNSGHMITDYANDMVLPTASSISGNKLIINGVRRLIITRK
jgi:hypothetical protein